MTAGQVIGIVLRFVLTPIVLLGTLGWASGLTEGGTKTPQPAYVGERIAALWLGIFVGLLLCVLHVASHPNLSIFPESSAPVSVVEPWALIYVACGISLGLTSMAIRRRFEKTKIVSVLIAGVSALSILAIYFMFFSTTPRDPIILISVSYIIGLVGYTVVVGSQ